MDAYDPKQQTTSRSEKVQVGKIESNPNLDRFAIFSPSHAHDVCLSDFLGVFLSLLLCSRRSRLFAYAPALSFVRSSPPLRRTWNVGRKEDESVTVRSPRSRAVKWCYAVVVDAQFPQHGAKLSRALHAIYDVD